MPANGLMVNRYDSVALHSMWRISKGLMCLSTSGNYYLGSLCIVTDVFIYLV